MPKPLEWFVFPQPLEWLVFENKIKKIEIEFSDLNLTLGVVKLYKENNDGEYKLFMKKKLSKLTWFHKIQEKKKEIEEQGRKNKKNKYQIDNETKSNIEEQLKAFWTNFYRTMKKVKLSVSIIKGETSYNPLVCACQKGYLNMVKILIMNPYTIDGKGSYKNISVERFINDKGLGIYRYMVSPIDAAKKAGHIQIVRYLENFAINLLHSAIEIEKLERVTYLVNTFTTIDVIGHTNSKGWNSLHYAAEHNVQMLQFLIDSYTTKYKKDIKDIINQNDLNGQTPLDMAYWRNKTTAKNAIVALLRRKGGKANYYDKNGKFVEKGKGDLSVEAEELKKKYKGTPLVCACEKGHLNDVRLLIDGHDVKTVVEMVSKEGASSDGHTLTPLQSAAENEQLGIAQYLVKRFPTVDIIGQTSSNGYNSLHWTALHSKKNVQMLQFLIDNYNGKDIKKIINQKTRSGWTPLDYAYEYNHSPIKNNIVSLLRKYGGKANYYDKNGKKVGQGKGDLNKKLYDNITIKF